MLYGYLISNTSNAEIGPLLYFTPTAESLYSRLQSLLRKLKFKSLLPFLCEASVEEAGSLLFSLSYLLSLCLFMFLLVLLHSVRWGVMPIKAVFLSLEAIAISQCYLGGGLPSAADLNLKSVVSISRRKM